MYKVMIEDHFAAAHRLLNYEGICENLHGHNWKVQVFAEGSSLDDAGILIDFKHLNSVLKDVIAMLDHTDLNSLSEFKDTSPSSELLARFIYTRMKAEIEQISQVSVWETEKSCAVYWE